MKLIGPRVVSALLGLLLGACSTSNSIEAPVAVTGIHALACGCALPEVGVCGEYLELEGRYIELVPPPAIDLGHMPFCGKDGLEAEVEGSLDGERAVLTSFRLSE